MAGSSLYLLRHEEYLRLTQNQSYVRENMAVEFMAQVMDKLYEEQLVPFTVHQDFGETHLTSAKADFILHLLITGTSYRYDAFCDLCREEHPEMYEKLYISDYNAASGLTTDSLQLEDDHMNRDPPTSSLDVVITRGESPPATLQHLDRQPAIIAINVVPVISPYIRAKISQTKTVYATSHPVRGIAMLFFNIHFTDHNFPTRTGAEHDLKNLSQLFHKLNYNVKVFKNMTQREVLRELDDQRQSCEHRNFGSFVLGFSTHGASESKAVAFSDGKSLYVHEIYKYFDSTHCPYLAGKPKFVFFDASSGCARDRAVPINKVLEPPKTFEPVKKQLVDISFSLGNIRLDTLKHLDVPAHYLVPSNISSVSVSSASSKVADKSDFIIAMSTFDGYVSWRRNSHGCWFSRIMVEVFQKHACDHHLVDLLKMIRRKLSYVETKTGYKQVSMTMDTSLKHFYFFPGISL